MAWLDEVAQAGARDLYEKVVLSLDVSDAMEFLVLECKHKERLIKILSKILKQEMGEEWWQMYCDHIVTQHVNITQVLIHDHIMESGKMVGGDIPL